MTRFTSVPGISRRLISLVPSKMRLMRESVLLVLDFLQMRQHLFADELFAGVGQPDLVRGEVFVDEWVAGSCRFDQEGPADGSCLIRLRSGAVLRIRSPFSEKGGAAESLDWAPGVSV